MAERVSRERELLQKVVNHMWQGELVDEIKEVLAQPKQDNIQYLLDQVARLTAENAMLKEKWSAPKQPEQEPVGEDAVNKCLANAIKDGWYPVNEDSYRQGFWDAVESLEDGE